MDQIAQSVTTYIDGVAQETDHHYFTYDGHGSTRALLDITATILQLYSFDAYGNAIDFNPTEALTEYLYSGEQFDSKIGQQYLRARYYDPATGRFNSLDSFFGNLDDPQSLHKYLYTHADPVNGIDPSGMMSIGGMVSSLGNMLTALNARIQPAFRVWRLAERIQSYTQFFQFFYGLTSIPDTIRKEAGRFITELSKSPNVSMISFRDLLYTLEYTFSSFVKGGIDGPLATIATLHKDRILKALLSLSQKKQKEHRLVIYLPTLPGKYTPDKQIINIPGEVAWFPLSLSFGGTGGRLWGIGFALPKTERTSPKTISYMLMRVDYHQSKERDRFHELPYASFFQSNNNAWMFHWQIPKNSKDARGGYKHE